MHPLQTALETHLLEDFFLGGKRFEHHSEKMQDAQVVVTRSNFGCGSSREHAVWTLEVNYINVVVEENYARIFRQNMFNCGILAIELKKEHIDQLFKMKGNIQLSVNLQNSTLDAVSDLDSKNILSVQFCLNEFDKKLVSEGGWLAYADSQY